MARPDFLKVKVYWKKGYDFIIYSHKILSRDSSYSVNAVVWPNFDKSSIFVRVAIITSISYGFDQKKGIVLVKVQ